MDRVLELAAVVVEHVEAVVLLAEGRHPHVARVVEEGVVAPHVVRLSDGVVPQRRAPVTHRLDRHTEAIGRDRHLELGDPRRARVVLHTLGEDQHQIERARVVLVRLENRQPMHAAAQTCSRHALGWVRHGR
eukprot:4661245-Prymnesium_polylepis.2